MTLRMRLASFVLLILAVVLPLSAWALLQLPRFGAHPQGTYAGRLLQSSHFVDDPAQYVEISYRVSETKFGAWPESLKSAFVQARTLKTGKPSFRLALIQE